MDRWPTVDGKIGAVSESNSRSGRKTRAVGERSSIFTLQPPGATMYRAESRRALLSGTHLSALFAAGADPKALEASTMEDDAASGASTKQEEDSAPGGPAMEAPSMDEDPASEAAALQVGAMRPRTRARYFAFVALYQFSTTFEPVEQLLRSQWKSDDGQAADMPMRTFATQLATLALKQLDTIDRLIEQYASQRALHRIAKVDLALLRLGSAELLYISDVPAAVAIDEMVELAKHFGADESPRFINAVLDAIQGHRADVATSEKVASEWTLTSA